MMTMEMINAKMDNGEELTQQDMDIISAAMLGYTVVEDLDVVGAESECNELTIQCMKEATKLAHGEYYPELDNLSEISIESIVEKCKDEMCVLIENIEYGDSRHRKVPVVLERKYRKFMNKWNKEEYGLEI